MELEHYVTLISNFLPEDDMRKLKKLYSGFHINISKNDKDILEYLTRKYRTDNMEDIIFGIIKNEEESDLIKILIEYNGIIDVDWTKIRFMMIDKMSKRIRWMIYIYLEYRINEEIDIYIRQSPVNEFLFLVVPKKVIGFEAVRSRNRDQIKYVHEKYFMKGDIYAPYHNDDIGEFPTDNDLLYESIIKGMISRRDPLIYLVDDSYIEQILDI